MISMSFNHLAVVRPTGTGRIVIKATAADLPEESVVVDVD